MWPEFVKLCSMLVKKLLVSTVFFLFLSTSIQAQSKINADSIRSKMQWFADAKLGIFIHWGLFSVPAWGTTVIDSAVLVSPVRGVLVAVVTAPSGIGFGNTALPGRDMSTMR